MPSNRCLYLLSIWDIALLSQLAGKRAGPESSVKKLMIPDRLLGAISLSAGLVG
jgi:hypothetical protein